MHVLGINAAFHDSSAAVIRDGVPVAAAEEERFTRIKHGKRPVPFLAYQLPFHAIDYCLREAGISLREVDRIAYSFDPALALGERDPSSLHTPLHPSLDPCPAAEDGWEPLFLAGILNAPRFLIGDVPHHLSHLLDGISSTADLPPWEYVEHHLAHAASAYYVSGFPEAAILTLDGRGERATTMHALGSGPEILPLQQVLMPHSLGMLYEHVTSYLGFLHSSDEYKVMALASAAPDDLVPAFERLVQTFEDGTYAVSPGDLESCFGPARQRGEPLERRHFAVARGLQAALETSVLDLVRWLHGRTGVPDLCLAGGVALNCVMNSRVRDQGPFERVFVQPAAGDAGTALGAAAVIDSRERGQAPAFTMHDAYLGPGFDDAAIQRALDRAQVRYERPHDIAVATARLLAQDWIVGWFQGRMEFGPRALGARSMVASPRDPAMKDRLNRIKDREEFRPVAPAVLAERAHEFFEPARPDPFMLFVTNVREERTAEIAAARHVDGTARVQTVDRSHAPLFHRLISAFAAETGIPVVVNTSFNSLGRPIVCTPEDALECYFTTPLDALAIGPFLLTKDGAGRRQGE